MEPQIAERVFREPFRVFGEIYLRPFWRDGREAPPLPLSKQTDGYSSGHW